MTLFFISAALLVVLSLAWLLVGLFRANESSVDQEAVNITLARERLATLDTALADGAIEQATYDYEREQLDYDLAADLRLEKQKKIRSGGHVSAAVIVAVFVPLAAGALYLNLGDPDALNRLAGGTAASNTEQANAQDSEQVTAGALVDLLPQMEERLNQQPDDIEGWRLLGRSYLSVGDFEKAINAFNRALALDGSSPATLAQLAEAIAMTRNGRLAGEPLEYVSRALAIDDDNEHALWLQSIAYQQAGDHASAVSGFDRLNAMAAGNAEALATIEQMRNVSVAALASSDGAVVPDGTDAAQTADEASVAQGTDGATSVDVTVDLSDEARADAQDDQTVFIFATATDGPPMPVAVARAQVADLPLTVTLDDSMAMLPNMTLSTVNTVSVGARISKTGNPAGESGDWYTELSDINPRESDALSLTIDQQQP